MVKRRCVVAAVWRGPTAPTTLPAGALVWGASARPIVMVCVPGRWPEAPGPWSILCSPASFLLLPYLTVFHYRLQRVQLVETWLTQFCVFLFSLAALLSFSAQSLVSSLLSMLPFVSAFLLRQLPLTLLRASTGHPVLVELKNGDTYSGVLVSIDSWMNLNLADAVRTSAEGDAFWSVPQVYIRGNTVKYVGHIGERSAKGQGGEKGCARVRLWCVFRLRVPFWGVTAAVPLAAHYCRLLLGTALAPVPDPFSVVCIFFFPLHFSFAPIFSSFCRPPDTCAPPKRLWILWRRMRPSTGAPPAGAAAAEAAMAGAVAVVVVVAAGGGVAASEAVGEAVAAGGEAQAADIRKFWEGRRAWPSPWGWGGGRSYAPQMLWRRQDAGRLAAACVGGVLAKDQRQVRCVDGCGRVVSWVCALALPGPIHGPSYSCGVQDGAAGSRGCRPGLCPHLPERAMIDGSTPGPVTRAEAASSVAAAALGDASPMQRRLTSSTGSACPSRQTKETRTPRERFA